MNNLERVPVARAAEELCICSLTVRFLMEKNCLPIGFIKKSQKRNTYVIYRNLLDDFKANGGSKLIAQKMEELAE